MLKQQEKTRKKTYSAPDTQGRHSDMNAENLLHSEESLSLKYFCAVRIEL